jgi:hypothetical protein
MNDISNITHPRRVGCCLRDVELCNRIVGDYEGWWKVKLLALRH